MVNKPQLQPDISEVRLQDPANRQVYKQVLALAATDLINPWRHGEFFDYFGYASTLIASKDGVVMGFLLFGFGPNTYHVLKLVVHPQYRRQGIASQLIAELVNDAFRHKRTRISVCLRETNLPSQLFFRALAFRHAQHLRGYYKGDSGEDAYQQVLHLPGDDESQPYDLPFRPWVDE